MKRMVPFLAVLLLSSLASARSPIHHTEWTAEARLWAARVCYAEGAWSEPDCNGILWVITKRFGLVRGNRYRDPGTKEIRTWRWLDMLREYAAVGDPRPSRIKRMRARQKDIRAMPWGDLSEIPGHVMKSNKHAKLAMFNLHWAETREFVQRWADGEFSDPCPRANHWGGRGDSVYQRGWKTIKCGDTENTFYRGR